MTHDDMSEYRNKRVERSSTDKMLGGVCGGLARYLNMDALLVRIIAALLILFTGFGPVVYLVAWLVLPVDSGGILAQDIADKANTWYKDQQAKKRPGSGTDPGMNPNPMGDPNMPNRDDLR